MQCPSCGAISKKRSLKCPECGAFRNKSSVGSSDRLVTIKTPITEAADSEHRANFRQSRSLIEFPGVKHSLPQWRKDLGERVREVQERRLRESASENLANETQPGNDVTKAPLLELLPQAEAEPLNPIVVAALRRIERAHVSAQAGGNYANYQGAAAVAYAEQPEFIPVNLIDEAGRSAPDLEMEHLNAVPERAHALAVVPDPIPDPESEPFEMEPVRVSTRAKRLINGDANDPALNYLDTIPTTATVDDTTKRIAPVYLRFLSSLVDLMVVGLVTWVPLAVSGLTDLAFKDSRALALAVATLIVVAFLYSTIATALTGQTLGMKLFSLRVIDARTRMLPTGSQSAGRAAVYILSVATSGIPLMYTLIDRDKRSAHDRFTRTEVVRI